MEKLVGSIRVRDAAGEELNLYEYHRREFRRLIGPLRIPRAVRRWMLDTGENARRIDDCTFEILGTGERLHRFD